MVALDFNARLDFDDTVELSGRIAVLVAYNTESSGFEPVGQSRTLTMSLNVAVADDTPLVGSDVDGTGMLRFRSGGFYQVAGLRSTGTDLHGENFASQPVLRDPA